MKKKYVIIIVVLLLLFAIGNKLFADQWYFNMESEYTQEEFYERFSIKEPSAAAGFEEYFVHKKYGNPYVLLFKKKPAYEQMYAWDVKDRSYIVHLAAGDEGNSYVDKLNRIDDDQHYQVTDTGHVTFHDVDIYLEKVDAQHEKYTLYDYRGSFTYKDTHYSFALYDNRNDEEISADDKGVQISEQDEELVKQMLEELLAVS